MKRRSLFKKSFVDPPPHLKVRGCKWHLQGGNRLLAITKHTICKGDMTIAVSWKFFVLNTCPIFSVVSLAVDWATNWKPINSFMNGRKCTLKELHTGTQLHRQTVFKIWQESVSNKGWHSNIRNFKGHDYTAPFISTLLFEGSLTSSPCLLSCLK